MDKNFLLKFAYRNLMLHRLRSILTLAGMTIGISAIVFLVSFGFGIERLVTKEITNGDAYRLIDVGTGDSEIIQLNQPALQQISKISGVQNIETIVSLAGKAKSEDKSTDLAIFGTSAQYMTWSGLANKAGKSLEEAPANSMVVNTGYLTFLGLNKAEDAINRKEKIDLIIAKEVSDLSESKIVENQEFNIIGVVQNDSSPGIYVNASDLKELGVTNMSQAKLELSDKTFVSEVRKNIENLGFKTQYVGDTVAQIEQIFSVFKIILGSFGLIALVVASLGMFNTLTISLLERMKEVALLKILGMRRKDIRRLFLIESIIFGLSGGTVGVLLGYLISQVINVTFNYYAVKAGGETANIFYYPVSFIISMVVFAFVVGLLTGIYPSRRAAKIAPLDVIRYE